MMPRCSVHARAEIFHDLKGARNDPFPVIESAKDAPLHFDADPSDAFVPAFAAHAAVVFNGKVVAVWDRLLAVGSRDGSKTIGRQYGGDATLYTHSIAVADPWDRKFVFDTDCPSAI